MKAWIKWFDRQPAEDRRTIALKVIHQFIEEGRIAFWADDLVDKFGDVIPEDESREEHLYWNNEFKEDLRMPF